MTRALVIGAGLSGAAAASYLRKEGWQVVLVDRKPNPPTVLSEKMEFPRFIFDLVVVSPGIPLEHPLYLRAREEGVEVVGEMELALRRLENRMIGITGSNGKSTTVSLIAHVLNSCGHKARAVGNIGIPLLSLDPVDREEILVLEISSFQLETMQSRKLSAAAILNITPNHLDRYKTMEEYVRAKERIRTLVKKGAPCYEKLADNKSYARKITAHFGVKEEAFAEALRSFQTLPHRLEYVGEVRGVHCYNDSKATTPEAVSYAVKELEKDIVLICGGRNKGCSFVSWNDSFAKRVETIIVFGEAKELIKKELRIERPLYLVDSLEDAVEKGLQCASIGGTLLFSPGCASYDMFVNFEKRGERFKQILCEKKG